MTFSKKHEFGYETNIHEQVLKNLELNGVVVNLMAYVSRPFVLTK